VKGEEKRGVRGNNGICRKRGRGENILLFMCFFVVKRKKVKKEEKFKKEKIGNVKD
jgi:hypothetical protein